MSLSAAKYEAALLHPFSPAAEGATYPEPFAAHTVTRKVRCEFAIKPTTGGDFDLTIQPSVVYSAFSGQGVITGAPVVHAINNQPANANYFGAVPAATLASLAKSYRVVAVGVRLKANVDFTKSGGRVMVAVMPASQQLPAALSTGSTVSNFYDCFDVPHEALAGGSGRVITTSIIGLPRGHQLAVSELMSKSGVEITFPIVSAAATNFLETINQAEQGLVTTDSAGLINGKFSIGYASGAGHSQLLIRGIGLSTDASVSNVLIAEVVYHVEGVPNPIAGVSMVESVKKMAPASPNELAAIVHRAASVPAVQYVEDKVKASAGAWLNRARAAAGSAAGHEASRMLGIGMKALMLA